MSRTAVAAAVACAALAVPAAAPAAADPRDDHRRIDGCSFNAVQKTEVTGDEYVGYLWGSMVAYAAVPQHNPVTISDLRCEVRINHVPVAVVAGATAGPVGVVPPTSISFELTETDLLHMCTLYRVVDAHGNARDVADCEGTCCGPLTFPPEPVATVLEDLFGYVVDPEVCPVLRTQAGAHGPVTVESDGDVYVDGELWFDCPPYGA